MAKKKEEARVHNVNVIEVQSSEYLNSTSLEYALSTLDRAIPGIDGLKNSQRKAIFTLSKISGEIKTVSAAGRMISDNIYLHGDASAAGAIQQLASPVSNNYPLIGKRGGFGTQVNNDPASARYTYVKRNKSTDDLILRDMEIVPMQENYDGTVMEPKYFLPIIPISLFGANGISVGYKSEILPYRIEDIIKNCINVIDGKKQIPMLPYFNSYGCNTHVDNYAENKYTIYGRIEIIDASTVKVTGLPIKTTLEKFVEKLIKMEEEGKIRDYDDDSAKTIDVTIKLPRGTASGWNEMDALKYFGLHVSITQALIVLGENGKVKVYDTTAELIEDFVNFRVGYYQKRYERLLNVANDDLKIKRLIEACFNDGITAKIRAMENRQEVLNYINTLNIGINASDDAVQNIVNYPIHRWTKENFLKVQEDIKLILEDINIYTDVLADKNNLWAIYKSELQELAKGKYEPVEKC